MLDSLSNKLFKLPSITGNEKKNDGLSKPVEKKVDGSSPKYESKENNFFEKLFETKPNYIAKKIQPEDLQDEEKPPNYLSKGLDHILEEKSEESSRILDLVEEAGSEIDPINSNIKIKGVEIENIFQSELLKSNKFKEHLKGPIFKDGQIVKHSIVGPVELFEKHQKNFKKQPNRENTNSMDSSYNDITRRTHGNLFTESHSQMTAQGTLNTGSMRSVPRLGEKKKELKKEIKIHRDDLIKEIEKMKERERKFYEEEEKKLKNLQYEEKAIVLREKKCLDRYDHTLNNWVNMVDKTCQKLGRPTTESIILKAEDFRKKKEMADAFDMVKTDEEKYGDIYWYMTLRKDKDSKDWRQNTIKDIPEGFSASIIDRPKSSLSIIRRPMMNSKTCGTLPFREAQTLKKVDRTSQEYLEKKTEIYSRGLNRIRVKNEDQANHLVVGIIFHYESIFLSLF